MKSDISRRHFLSTAAAAGTAAAVFPRTAFAASKPEKVRLGLIGCGGRGYGAIADALAADPATELVAIADLFQDRVDALEDHLPRSMARRFERMGKEYTEAQVGEMAMKRASVPKDRRFVGWGAYKQLCALDDVDIVVMAPPPVFRPIHLEAALAANKHVFMEKPVCVDATGARRMLELADVADKKKLCVVAGTQRRHQESYVEGMKRLHDGQIGDIVAAQCYWLQGGYVGSTIKFPEVPVDRIRYQVRNWPLFVWTCGDHIVEQHVHNIDVVLWALGGPPEQCVAQGGRGVDLPMPEYGNRFSHFAAEFDYGDGVMAASYCRQEPGTFGRVSERILGTKGILDFKGRETTISGENPWSFDGEEMDPYVQEHIDLIAAVRSGNHVNETRQVTTSCATAILGRESAYTGRAIKYEWLLQRSQQDLTPSTWEDGTKAIDPLPIPGKTELV